jgi:hypothetical protein
MAPAKARVDELTRELHSHMKWQSDRTIPRTSFPGGITTLTKMQGIKRTGVLLLLLLRVKKILDAKYVGRCCWIYLDPLYFG